MIFPDVPIVSETQRKGAVFHHLLMKLFSTKQILLKKIQVNIMRVKKRMMEKISNSFPTPLIKKYLLQL